MPPNHLILCHPLLPPSIFPSNRVFSNKSTVRIRWPTPGGVSASAPVLPMKTQDWFPLELTGQYIQCVVTNIHMNHTNEAIKEMTSFVFLIFFAFLFSQDLPLIDHIKIRAAWLRHVTQFAKTDLTALAKRQPASFSLSRLFIDPSWKNVGSYPVP